MLISKDEFVGLDDVIHLAAGGETPALKSHQQAVAQFFADKGMGEPSRPAIESVYARCKEKVGQLLGVSAENLAFLSHASDGVNLFAHSIDWQAGDNVVIADVEFPSDSLPWTTFAAQGVEIRVVQNEGWRIELDDIAAQIDERTRVVCVSLVSYFTGQRLLLADLSKLVRSTNALLLVDATHAIGSVDVAAEYADVLVSSCYKWLLGVHGVGIFYWNPERLPDLQPPFLGWHSLKTIPHWSDPTSYQLKEDGGRFEPGNPSYIGLYILDNSLDKILSIGIKNIEAHNLELSGYVWAGLAEAGCEMMTPQPAAERAGNVCFMAQNIDGILQSLSERGILVWGSYAGVTRVRVSTHLYNSAEDVARFLRVVKQVELK